MYLSSGKFCRLLGRSLHVLVHTWITEHRCHQSPATQDPSHGVPLSTYRYSQHRPGVGRLLEIMLRLYFQCRPQIPGLMLYVFLQSSSFEVAKVVQHEHLGCLQDGERFKGLKR